MAQLIISNRSAFVNELHIIFKKKDKHMNPYSSHALHTEEKLYRNI
jgi:hypothetical protein